MLLCSVGRHPSFSRSRQGSSSFSIANARTEAQRGDTELQVDIALHLLDATFYYQDEACGCGGVCSFTRAFLTLLDLLRENTGASEAKISRA